MAKEFTEKNQPIVKAVVVVTLLPEARHSRSKESCRNVSCCTSGTAWTKSNAGGNQRHQKICVRSVPDMASSEFLPLKDWSNEGTSPTGMEIGTKSYSIATRWCR
jgi:hypothetical protein